MNPITLGSLLLAGLTLSACATNAVFPADVMTRVDPTFDFSRWRMTPNQAEAKTIQLGGRILSADSKGNRLTLVVAQLPIVEHPAYGPKDTGKRSGEFAITYTGTINAAFLQPGNRVMVVGVTRAPILVSVDDLQKSLPTISATCLHFWNTGGRDIADFPSFGAGYETLEEETACINTP